eukprot:gene1516-4667_t
MQSSPSPSSSALSDDDDDDVLDITSQICPTHEQNSKSKQHTSEREPSPDSNFPHKSLNGEQIPCPTLKDEEFLEAHMNFCSVSNTDGQSLVSEKNENDEIDTHQPSVCSSPDINITSQSRNNQKDQQAHLKHEQICEFEEKSNICVKKLPECTIFAQQHNQQHTLDQTEGQSSLNKAAPQHTAQVRDDSQPPNEEESIHSNGKSHIEKQQDQVEQQQAHENVQQLDSRQDGQKQINQQCTQVKESDDTKTYSSHHVSIELRKPANQTRFTRRHKPPNWSNPFALPSSQDNTAIFGSPHPYSSVAATNPQHKQLDEPGSKQMSVDPEAASMAASLANLTMTENVGEVVPFPTINPEEAVPNFEVAFDYIAREVDEIDLHKGDLLYVIETGPDGWYVGLNINTGAQGTFPGNFLVRLEHEPEGDEELALRLQQEEELSMQQLAQLEKTEDEILAQQVQEEEDMMYALQQQHQFDSEGNDFPKRSTPKVFRSKPRMQQASPASDYESFIVRFLGSLNVPKQPNLDTLHLAIREVLAARKRLKYTSTKTFEFQVSLRGIRLVEQSPKGLKRRSTLLRRRTNSMPPERATTASLFPLHHVSHCAYDESDHKSFGFITRNAAGDKFACHVFQYTKSATTIVNAIG